MKKADALAYFGNQQRLAAALGVSQPAVSQWGELVPERYAYRLQVISGGVLVYDFAAYGSPATADGLESEGGDVVNR